MNKPTILDLARELGLSKTTVADALKGSGRVSEKTRMQVREHATKMGYVPNRAAQQLRARATGAIALYIPQRVRNMSFYMPFALGAADAAAEHGYDLTLVSDTSVGARSWSHVDGALLIDATLLDPAVRSLLAADLPIVTGGRMEGMPPGRSAGTVEIEHARLCAVLLDVMAAQGARHVSLICPKPADRYSWAQQLINGYEQWCARHAMPSLVQTMEPYPSDDEIAGALEGALRRGGADSLLFGWQDVALRAESLLMRSAYSARGSIKLASLLSWPDMLPPTYVTGLDLRPYEFGRASAQLLHDAITGSKSALTNRTHEPVLLEQPSARTSVLFGIRKMTEAEATGD